MDIELIKSIGIIIASISAIIASITAIIGINSWRQESKWKRKYELAEDVLANVYVAHQSIRTIRSPIGFGGEGESRKVGENETQNETKVYNQAYVVIERFNRNKKAIENLQVLKFRFIAIFGKTHEKHFDKIAQILNKIFIAASEIARIRLGEYGNDPQIIGQEIRKNNLIIYSRGNIKEDEIEQELIKSIEYIEKECRTVIGRK